MTLNSFQTELQKTAINEATQLVKAIADLAADTSLTDLGRDNELEALFNAAKHSYLSTANKLWEK